MDMSLSKLQKIVEDREAWRASAMGLQSVRHNLATKWQMRLKNKWEPTVQHRELYLVLCGDLNGKEI